MKDTGLHTDDKSLFNLIASGNEAAFEELFLSYIPRLEPVVSQIVRRKDEVKDIIQEVFLHLWLGRDKLPEVEDPRKWIFKIMYNRCYRWVNRQLVEAKAQQAIRTSRNEDTSVNQVEDAVGFSETSRLVKQAIRQLPPQSRKIYMLSREEGLKLSEIACQLGLSLQSVKNSLHRSGNTIREYLAERGVYLPLIFFTWISSCFF